MTRDEILLDLYSRLVSRKLWLTLLSVAFAYWNFYEARLSALEFQAAIFGAIGVYTFTEGLADAARAHRPAPSAGNDVMVSVEQPEKDPKVLY